MLAWFISSIDSDTALWQYRDLPSVMPDDCVNYICYTEWSHNTSTYWYNVVVFPVFVVYNYRLRMIILVSTYAIGNGFDKGRLTSV
jgi:hypothetical protein